MPGRPPTPPPFPWTLRIAGTALASVHTVPLAAARRLIPSGFRILRVWPGHTLGGLFFAHYGPGSELEYHELVACAGVVLYRCRPCAWISHVYVDSEASLRAGREEIGVPKRLARFGRGEGGSVIVGTERDGVDLICALTPRRAVRAGSGVGPIRLRFRAIHGHAARPPGAVVSLHGNQLRGRVASLAIDVRVPPGSPLRALEIGKPLLGLAVTEAVGVLGGADFQPYHEIMR